MVSTFSEQWEGWGLWWLEYHFEEEWEEFEILSL